MKRLLFSLGLLFIVLLGPQLPAAAQNSADLNPNTQQYINNLNEVREAQNGTQAANNSSAPISQGPSAWSYIFYGILSGAAYALWRWIKKLKS